MRRRENLHWHAGTGLQLVQQRQRFVVQHTGVKHKNFYAQSQAADQVADHHVFSAQAAGLGDQHRPANGDRCEFGCRLDQQFTRPHRLGVKISRCAGIQGNRRRSRRDFAWRQLRDRMVGHAVT